MPVPIDYNLFNSIYHFRNYYSKIRAMNLLLFTLLSIFFQFELIAQTASIPTKTSIFNENSFKEYRDELISTERFFELKKEAFGLENCEMVLINSNKLKSDLIHLKYQQYYKGIPIYNSMYYLHTKDGEVQSSNGMLYPFIEINTEPKINTHKANQIAQKYFLTIINDKKINHNDVKIISTELFITDKSYPNFSGNYALAYKIIATIKLINKKQEILVDAHNGQIIFNQSKIHHIDRPSKAKTKYYGEQDIISDSIGVNEFVLRDNNRNITTFTDKKNTYEKFTDTDGYWDQFNADQDEVALDAHYTTSRFYDMMLEKFNYRGVDGKGGAMNPIVHIQGGSSVVNAFWDGENAAFGNGDCHHSPLTTFSVVAHEFTHGVTQYNSALIYNGESGAINESLSDIFGKAAEYYYDRNRFSWELDPIFKKTKYPEVFRSFSDPNRLSMPKTYKGKFWEDIADVHTNSSVFNHWFYLMVTGETAKNEFGVAYSIKAMPILDVLNVIFKCQTSYLTPSSGYKELAKSSLIACKELYGQNSEIYISMQNAWIAVNVDDKIIAKNITDLEITINVDELNTCADSAVHSFTMTLRNTGNQIIKANSRINYNINFQSYSPEYIPRLTGNIILSTDLAPGDKIEKVFQNAFSMKFFGLLYIYAYINFQDDYNTNNNVNLTLYNSNPKEGDILLDLQKITNYSCFGKENAAVTYVLTNNSCKPIPSGTKSKVILSLENEVKMTKEITFIEALNEGESLTFVDSFFNDRNGLYYMDIENNLDPYPISNHDSAFSVYKIINNVMDFTFENADYRDFFTETYVFSNPLINYNNSTQFGTTGYYEKDYGSYFPCENIIRSLTDEINPSLKTCIDFSNLGITSMSFDLTQFRADSSKYPELWSKSAAMQLTLKSENNTLDKFYFDQKEASKINHQLSLGNNFKGELTFTFYNNLGPFSLSLNALNYDAQLLDNLNFSTIVNQNDLKSDRIKIYPNPAHDKIYFSNVEENIYKGELINLDGKKLKSFQVSSRNQTIDINDLANGMYILKLISNSKKTEEFSFIKQSN